MSTTANTETVRYGVATTGRVHFARKFDKLGDYQRYAQACGMRASQHATLGPLTVADAREWLVKHPDLACKRCGVAEALAAEAAPTGQSPDLTAALATAHSEAHALLARLAERVDAVDPDTANWGHVGDLNALAGWMRVALGEA